MATEFNLKARIEDWKSELSEKGLMSQDNIAELESHLQDEMDQLLINDLTLEEAYFIALKRLGQIQELKTEYSKVHTQTIVYKKLLPHINGALVFILLGMLLHISRDYILHYFSNNGVAICILINSILIITFLILLGMYLIRSEWNLNTVILIFLILLSCGADSFISSNSNLGRLSGGAYHIFSTILYGGSTLVFYIISIYIYYQNSKEKKLNVS